MANTNHDRDGICPTCGKTFDRFPNWNYARPKKYCSPACYQAARQPAVATMCPACGKEFHYHVSWPRKYCSKACYESVRSERRLSTECPTCGKTFEYHASWPRKYCSRACAGRATIQNIPTFEASRYEATCQQCGRVFETTPRSTRGRFCSLACYGKWCSEHQSGENHPNFGRVFGRAAHLPPPIQKTCPLCGTVFTIKPSQAKRRRFCCRQCADQDRARRMAGEANWNWLGGSEPYYGPSWPAARRTVLERDVVCQDCGKTAEENGQALDIHHLVAFRTFGRDRHEEANAVTNLIALCRQCHRHREHLLRTSGA